MKHWKKNIIFTSHAGGSLEGKEVRIGPDESSLWAVTTTDASNGSVNSMHDSYQALGGVAPIPWRLPEVERMLTGQRMTAELAAKAGDVAVAGARPLAKNGYKVPMTRAMVARTIAALSEVRSA